MTDWTEWVRCDHCDGSGLHPRRFDNTACPECRGEGVLDCNCPGLCVIHRAHTLPEPGEPAPWVDPWANHTEPPF